jgi:hypothetical protein
LKEATKLFDSKFGNLYQNIESMEIDDDCDAEHLEENKNGEPI